MPKVNAIIADIDECLCKTSFIFDEAAHKQLWGNDLWDYFHQNVHRCIPNPWCVDLIKKYSQSHFIIFITARSEEIREITEEFLRTNLGFKSFTLAMRPLNDTRPSAEVKQMLLKELQADLDLNILFAIDDEEDNCRMFKNSGITALKVFKG